MRTLTFIIPTDEVRCQGEALWRKRLNHIEIITESRNFFLDNAWETYNTEELQTAGYLLLQGPQYGDEDRVWDDLRGWIEALGFEIISERGTTIDADYHEAG